MKSTNLLLILIIINLILLKNNNLLSQTIKSIDLIPTDNSFSVYEGSFKKNKIHGKGKFTDSSGNIYEGKFKYGKFIKKISINTRQVLKLNLKTGVELHFEMKGEGQVSTKWFEAKKNSSGGFEYTERGKREMDMAASEAVGNSGSSSAGSCGG